LALFLLGSVLLLPHISRDVIENESIINLPKMKTHGLTMYTGAIKNLFGTICGADKTRIHALGASIGGFSQCLVDLFSFLKPKIKLTIMDAIIAMEGRGPGVAGKPVEMNLILASADVVALDAVAFRLMGHNPKKVPAIKLAAEQGLGQIKQEEIEIVGEKIAKHKKKFKLPFSAAIARIPFARFSKIILSVPKYRGGCTNCQTCVKACPKSVITIVKNKKGEPEPQIDYSGCISCFTCSEVCPEACYVEKMKYLPHIILAVISLLGIIGAIVAIVILL
jgi:ferredoxin